MKTAGTYRCKYVSRYTKYNNQEKRKEKYDGYIV